MLTSWLKLFLCFIILSCFSRTLSAQPTWTIDPFGNEKKPAQYEEKKLASEKTGDKKLTTFRRIIQNNTTHYNFYFNANNKINTVIERAKLAQKDDYTELLSFYPYSLENTVTQKTELDSVIYKATAGILLHDLRSDWVDNMYLLIGKAYFLRKEFDSAALTFQFINYNLFPRKKKNDDDDRIVGTNDASATGELSIANKEQRNIVQKILTLPPSRNDALIWLTKTFIEQQAYGDAAGMINILAHDKNLPARLRNDLEEVMSYWFFAQNNFDSASTHLARALTNADSKEDKSRWEYLLAQLYEMNGHYDEASSWYQRVSKHTNNPVMDIYARLNDAKMLRNSGNTKELANSIANLLKMARREKFESYRDIIYYSTGQLSMQLPDTAASSQDYLKSIKYSIPNSGYRNRSFLQLGDISFAQKRYGDAYNYYDSLDLTDKSLEKELAGINDRKEILLRIVQHTSVIEHQDSMQQIAALSPAERDQYINKIVKKHRKEAGLKDEDNSSGGQPISFNNSKDAPIDLFPSDSKGDWYFYNSSLRSRGLGDFKSKWGKRDNVDNWRRKSAAEAALAGSLTSGVGNYADPSMAVAPLENPANSSASAVPFSYDALMAEVPLSTERMDSSNTLIDVNMLALAKIFQNELLDYNEAINEYTTYLQRSPGRGSADAEAYLGLYYCYAKLGMPAKADYYKNIVTSKFPMTNSATAILNPSLLEPNKKSPEVTQRYAAIYDMFIEGKFAEATEARKKEDSVHGTSYWTPQLLYIEAVYDIKERKDSNAISVLNKLEQLYPQSPLKAKAVTLIDVLSRRSEIEKYLTDLQLTRAEEEKQIFVDETTAPVANAPVTQPQNAKPVVVIAPVVKPNILRDSIIKVPDQFVSGSFIMKSDQPQYVAMILDKVDGVYINEAKNAFNRFNQESYYTQKIVITRDAVDGERTLLLFAPFENAAAALLYFDKIRKAAPSEISWLPAAKYSFMIISDSNLQVLKTNKDLTGYKKLLNANFSNKF